MEYKVQITDEAGAVHDQKTKIELIWKGQKYEVLSNDIKIEDIKKRMSRLVDIISEGLTDDVIKQKLRNYLLNDILDDKI